MSCSLCGQAYLTTRLHDKAHNKHLAEKLNSCHIDTGFCEQTAQTATVCLTIWPATGPIRLFSISLSTTRSIPTEQERSL